MAGMAKPIKKSEIKDIGKNRELSAEQDKWAASANIDNVSNAVGKRNATNVLVRLNLDELNHLDYFRSKIGASRAGFFRMAFMEKVGKMINKENQ